MSNNFDKLKDFLYEIIDYIIIISIILIVFGVIGWRLDLLFSNSEVESISKVSVSKETTDSINKLKKKNKEALYESDERKVNDTTNSNINKNDNIDKNLDESINDKTSSDISQENVDLGGRSLSITIPDGANSSSIGDILQENGIISSSSEFVSKSEELNLSTKLKSGTFTLSTSDDLETVLNKLTK